LALWRQKLSLKHQYQAPDSFARPIFVNQVATAVLSKAIPRTCLKLENQPESMVIQTINDSGEQDA